MNGLISFERAHELFSYDANSGVLTWRVRRNAHGGPVNPGDTAGCVCPRWGYVLVGVDGIKVRAHRLIWLMVTGEQPPEQLDHRDGARANNRWVNLRASGHGLNQQNVALRPSASGLRGVHRCGPRWSAQICFRGKKTHLGVFATKEQAAEVYLKARASTFEYQPTPRELMEVT